MPTIEENLKAWDTDFDWRGKKPGWCERTIEGVSFWNFCLLPRMCAYIPANTILELGPGYGRWSDFLRYYCKQLILVDLAPTCIQACRERFISDSHISYFVNDGTSLAMVPDHSVDFVFSFDSLVHCEIDVVEAYLKEISRKLTPDGMCFLHHSNAAAILKKYGVSPDKNIWEGKKLICGGRALSVSHEKVRDLCGQYELQCHLQESINWNSADAIDCLSLISRKASKWTMPYVYFENTAFLAYRTFVQNALRYYSCDPNQNSIKTNH